eukprot:123612_1
MSEQFKIIKATIVVEIGPIYNQRDAEKQAKKYETEHAGDIWNGQWWTTVWNTMSVIMVDAINYTETKKSWQNILEKEKKFVETLNISRQKGTLNNVVFKNILDENKEDNKDDLELN